MFQSTLPRRERPYKPDQYSKVVQFQSTLPRRERLTCVAVVTLPRSFQSTLPRRERPFHLFLEFHFCCFNPRSHEGSDKEVWKMPQCRQVSIHAPTKGATKSGDHYTKLRIVSIHAPTKGATQLPQTKGVSLPFQSTLPRRERRRLDCTGFRSQ